MISMMSPPLLVPGVSIAGSLQVLKLWQNWKGQLKQEPLPSWSHVGVSIMVELLPLAEEVVK